MGRMKWMGVAGLGACAAMMWGCGASKLTGRVIEGRISFVGVVDGSDARLGQPGIGQATIMVEHPDGAAGDARIATGTTGADGSISLSIPGKKWPTDRVLIRATAADHAPARGVLYLPRDGQKLLILLERTAAD